MDQYRPSNGQIRITHHVGHSASLTLSPSPSPNIRPEDDSTWRVGIIKQSDAQVGSTLGVEASADGGFILRLASGQSIQATYCGLPTEQKQADIHEIANTMNAICRRGRAEA